MTAGKNFLVVADRLSGWPVVSCGTDTTSSATIRHFRRIFRDLGVPVRLRTDGGPQFASREFAEFLEQWEFATTCQRPIAHSPTATPSLQLRPSNISFRRWPRQETWTVRRSTGAFWSSATPPNHASCSPAQTLYGHPLRSCVPAHARAFQKEWQARAESCDRRAAVRHHNATARYDAHAKPLLPLALDTQVRLQDPTTKRWDMVGTIMSVGRSRDYLVRMLSGRVLWRNRRLLRPVLPHCDDRPAEVNPPVEPDPSRTTQPRCSDRIKAKKDKKNAQDNTCYERKGKREM